VGDDKFFRATRACAKRSNELLLDLSACCVIWIISHGSPRVGHKTAVYGIVNGGNHIKELVVKMAKNYTGTSAARLCFKDPNRLWRMDRKVNSEMEK